jgi:hypothetical protein
MLGDFAMRKCMIRNVLVSVTFGGFVPHLLKTKEISVLVFGRYEAEAICATEGGRNADAVAE